MIRFSAGLVVVAIGVLIGGVATSKLSLVYVAIAVSALALITLAVGVALKRDELFGGGPESAPAGAGADSGMPAGQSVGAGDVRGTDGHVREGREQTRRHVPGPATAAFEAAAAAQARVAASTAAAPSMTTPTVSSPAVSSPSVGLAADNSPFGNPPLAHRRTAFGQAPRPRATLPPTGRRARRSLRGHPATRSARSGRPRSSPRRHRRRHRSREPLPLFPRVRGRVPSSRRRRRRGPDRGQRRRPGSTG